MQYIYESRTHLLEDTTQVSIYRNKDFSYMAHWHTEFELVYIEEGTLEISINNDRRKLAKGDMAIITSGDIHYYHQTENTSSKSLLLVFKPEFFGFSAHFPDTCRFLQSFYKKDSIDEEGMNQAIAILKYILEEKRYKKSHYELMVKAKVIELCGLLLRYLPTCSIEEGNKQLGYSNLLMMQKILDYIENNFTESITLKGLAKKYNIDPYNLSKKFNAITGHNLKSYINTLRIAKAENLIMNTNKPMIDIAMECGFESIRTFNRTFKKIKGDVPSSLR